MSAESTLIFYGVRFPISSEDMEPLENRSDPRILTAKKSRLDHYWGNFAKVPGGEEYFLFIGLKIAIIGHEGDLEKRFETVLLMEAMRETDEKLLHAGFDRKPAFYAQFEPDC